MIRTKNNLCPTHTHTHRRKDTLAHSNTDCATPTYTHMDHHSCEHLKDISGCMPSSRVIIVPLKAFILVWTFFSLNISSIALTAFSGWEKSKLSVSSTADQQRANFSRWGSISLTESRDFLRSEQL